ncbi:WhiB family transcriptional regulator [Streptomyces sp. NPDC093586]
MTAPCLALALETGQASGVWEGTREEERVALLRIPGDRAAGDGGRAARLP